MHNVHSKQNEWTMVDNSNRERNVSGWNWHVFVLQSAIGICIIPKFMKKANAWTLSSTILFEWNWHIHAAQCACHALKCLSHIIRFGLCQNLFFFHARNFFFLIVYKMCAVIAWKKKTTDINLKLGFRAKDTICDF